MLEADLPELALAGDRGIDLFRRVEDPDQRRVHYECIATAHPAPPENAPRLEVFFPQACRQPDRLWQAVARYQNAPGLHQAFAFGHPAGYPSMRDPATRLALFQCLEFFRTRLVADLTIASYEEKLTTEPERAARYFAETAGALKLLVDYNMLIRARPICKVLAPLVIARVQAPGFIEDGDQATGFSLRLLGDLYLRDDAPADALACFEAAIAAADNPFRRRKAIAAARALGDTARCLAHIDSFEQAGRVPPDLAALRQTLTAPDA
mgnify:CR=1 FL=1